MSDKQPIYNAKVKMILDMMRYKTRDEVAEELSYKNWKSLDMYMRRKNFSYDSRAKEYKPVSTRVDKLSQDPKSYAPSRVASVINAFDEEGTDPQLVAKQAGFKDYKEMAEYMKKKGYEWNAHHNNYLKVVGKEEEPLEAVRQAEDKELPADVKEYLPFLRFLYEKRDDIYQLLTGVKEDGKIPRYALPGMVRTKAVYMSDTVAKLAAEFSREKNITQREVMEAALVEYLQKYGFKQEIEALLKNQ